MDQQYQTTLDILHAGFIICTVLAVLFLLVTALLFWRFGMLTVIQQRFGIEAKRTIEEFREQNESTGALKYHSVALGERTPQSLHKPEGADTGISGAMKAFRRNSRKLADKKPPAAPSPPASPLFEEAAPQTTRLDNSGAIAEMATAQGVGAAVAMQGVGAAAAAQGEAVRGSPPNAGFEVTRNVLLIHTSRDTLVP
jgi:hypothetical protein